MKKVRKAVITAAGWGTRFLPITRSLPKEMLPLLDKPLIQFSIEETVRAGIEQVIVITAPGKKAIGDYFGGSPELGSFLEKKGDRERLRRMRELPKIADIRFVLQREPRGLGHAILMAAKTVGDEPFAVILPDDVIDSKWPLLKGMVAIYEKYGAGVLAVERVSDEDTWKYGIIKSGKIATKIHRVLDLVEKPGPSVAPSRLGIVGRYVLTPQIFDVLRVTPPGINNEIQLTDALSRLLKKQELYAYEFTGVRYDTGTPLGWLKANIALALKRDDIRPRLKEYLNKLVAKG
jgi:UTP--glucose-1-phosphate uridylyltransferase